MTLNNVDGAAVRICFAGGPELATVTAMNVPDDLLYSTDHEWVQRVGEGVRIGITDYAQDALGDVVYVQVPAVGTSVVAGQSFSEVESTKSVSDIYSPITGTVVAVNEALDGDPAVVNSDPYGNGWLCVIEPSVPEELESLLDATAYRALTEG